MMILKRLSYLILALNFIVLPKAQAQSTVYGNPMRDITVVGASTLGGAILGLSTLSFVEEPGDHLKNILVGGAFGLILGVAIVAYGQAKTTSARAEYSLGDIKKNDEWTSVDKKQWIIGQAYDYAEKKSVPTPSINYSFNF